MKLTAYVHLRDEYSQLKVHIFDQDMTNVGFQLIGKHEFDFDVPDLDDVALKIANIEAQKEILKRAFYSRLEELNATISQYQCLEMTP